MSNSDNHPVLSEETLRNLLELQREEMAVRLREVEADRDSVNVHREVTLQTIEATKINRQEIREMQERESTKSKQFVVIITILIFSFVGVMTFGGYADTLFPFLQEMLKYIFGAIGGSGLTIIYFFRNRTNDD